MLSLSCKSVTFLESDTITLTYNYAISDALEKRHYSPILHSAHGDYSLSSGSQMTLTILRLFLHSENEQQETAIEQLLEIAIQARIS